MLRLAAPQNTFHRASIKTDTFKKKRRCCIAHSENFFEITPEGFRAKGFFTMRKP